MRVYCYMRVGTKEQMEETPVRKEPVQKTKQVKKKTKKRR